MTIPARRGALKVEGIGHHPGLALARYLKNQDDKHAAGIDLFNAVKGSQANEAYGSAFQRWADLVKSRPQTTILSATLVSSLAIGLGNESALEVGLTTHHTYGMPMIPGSATKGLCSHAARDLWNRKAGDAETTKRLEVMFGSHESASLFTFWDAWYDPSSVEGKPFHRDTITVHHPAYYASRGIGAWPTDFDDPIPVPFLVIRPRARFLFAFDGPTQEWRDFLKKLIEWSLKTLGIGGKTRSGYGLMQVAAGSA